MATPVELLHTNHDGVSFTEVSNQLRATVLPNTVMVHYNGTWGTRPNAVSVLAVGSTQDNPPSWLTVNDIHFFEVVV